MALPQFPKELTYLHLEPSALSAEDEIYLDKLIKLIRSGKRAIIVAEADGKLKYMFSNASRAEAVAILGEVVAATGKKIQKEQGE